MEKGERKYRHGVIHAYSISFIFSLSSYSGVNFFSVYIPIASRIKSDSSTPSIFDIDLSNPPVDNLLNLK